MLRTVLEWIGFNLWFLIELNLWILKSSIKALFLKRQAARLYFFREEVKSSLVQRY